MPSIIPNSNEARDAVNVFTSIDVLGMLGDTSLPSEGGVSVEYSIKNFYKTTLRNHFILRQLWDKEDTDPESPMSMPLQDWDPAEGVYKFNDTWAYITSLTPEIKRFGGPDSPANAQEFFAKYVRLIANRGDTHGWKLKVDASDLTGTPPNQYLTEAYNLCVKARPGQWIRWWGNCITPFSSLQCIIHRITNAAGSAELAQLQHQQDLTVDYKFPSARVSDSKYETMKSVAYSRVGQLDPGLDPNANPAIVIPYNIMFMMVDEQGNPVASFQVDPEIRVIG